MKKSTMWAMFLIIASCVAAIAFPVWWVGLICFFITYHAFRRITYTERQIKGISA